MNANLCKTNVKYTVFLTQTIYPWFDGIIEDNSAHINDCGNAYNNGNKHKPIKEQNGPAALTIVSIPYGPAAVIQTVYRYVI